MIHPGADAADLGFDFCYELGKANVVVEKEKDDVFSEEKEKDFQNDYRDWEMPIVGECGNDGEIVSVNE